MRGLPTATLAVAIAALTGSAGKANVIDLNRIVDISGQGLRNALRLITVQAYKNKTIEPGDIGITRGIITALTPGIRSLRQALGQMLFAFAGPALALRQSRRQMSLV
jgi:hypothetical protein